MDIAEQRTHDDSPLMLEFNNVTVIKENKKVLDSLSLKILDGENIAILGPNGAGKSSFIRTITREYYPSTPTENTVFRIWGMDTWDVFALRPLLGIVSNDLQHSFIRDLPGKEVILSGFFSSVGLFRHSATFGMEERANEVMSFLEIDHLRDRLMTEMSSGEARRFLVGRALVHNPRALILDEPTNSLDLHALHTLRGTMRKIARQGTGIILVTHHLHDIIPEISRVILMKEGRFWKDGSKTGMLTDSNIGNLFDVPVHVKEEDGWFYATGY